MHLRCVFAQTHSMWWASCKTKIGSSVTVVLLFDGHTCLLVLSVEHYRTTPMVETSGEVVELKKVGTCLLCSFRSLLSTLTSLLALHVSGR